MGISLLSSPHIAFPGGLFGTEKHRLHLSAEKG